MITAAETTAEVSIMPDGGGALATALSVPAILRHYQLVQNVLRLIMKKGVHYGESFPGDKKVNLLKPGADALCLAFQLAPEYEAAQTNLPNGHREVSVVCKLRTPAGRVIGQGVGSCSTMETKYRYRNAAKKCPECGAETIIKGKEDFGGGWLCYVKKGGCGAKFADGSAVIEEQLVGKIENPDPADQWNTALKIAKKRAHVDATITATAASDIFSQDAEDFESRAEKAESKEAAKRPAPAAAAPGTDRHAKTTATPAAAATTAAKPASSASSPAASTNAAPAAGIKGRRPHGPDVMGEATNKADNEAWYRCAIDVYGEDFAKSAWKAGKDYAHRFALLRGLVLDAETIETRAGLAMADSMIGGALNEEPWDSAGIPKIAESLRLMASGGDQQQQMAAVSAGAPADDDSLPPF